MCVRIRTYGHNYVYMCVCHVVSLCYTAFRLSQAFCQNQNFFPQFCFFASLKPEAWWKIHEKASQVAAIPGMAILIVSTLSEVLATGLWYCKSVGADEAPFKNEAEVPLWKWWLRTWQSSLFEKITVTVTVRRNRTSHATLGSRVLSPISELF